MAGFSDKSQGMQDFLNQLFPISVAQASGTCSACRGPATNFTSELTQREYGISGMCEACQKIAFAPPDEECTCEHPCCEADVGVGIITCGSKHCPLHGDEDL